MFKQAIFSTKMKSQMKEMEGNFFQSNTSEPNTTISTSNTTITSTTNPEPRIYVRGIGIVRKLSPLAEPWFPKKELSPLAEPWFPKKELSPLAEPWFPKKELSPLAEPWFPKKELSPLAEPWFPKKELSQQKTFTKPNEFNHHKAIPPEETSTPKHLFIQ